MRNIYRVAVNAIDDDGNEVVIEKRVSADSLYAAKKAAKNLVRKDGYEVTNVNQTEKENTHDENNESTSKEETGAKSESSTEDEETLHA